MRFKSIAEILRETIGAAEQREIELIAARARKRFRRFPSIVNALGLPRDPQEREEAIRHELLRCACEAWTLVRDEADPDTPVSDLFEPAVRRTLTLLSGERRGVPAIQDLPLHATVPAHRGATGGVAPSPEDEFMAREDAWEAWRIIASRGLSPQQELVMWLVASGEEELAPEYGIAPATFRQQKSRALKKLREPRLCPACMAKRRSASG